MVSAHRGPPFSYPVLAEGPWRSFALTVHEGSPSEPPKPRLLDRVRSAVRIRHYSRRTEEAYVAWILRYIRFHHKRQPAEMGAPELTRFLSSLAIEGKVAASTQNQALCALLFLYRQLLDLEVPWLQGRAGPASRGRQGTAARDLQHGAGWVELPTALGRKYPNAGREWVWQWVFSSDARICGPGHPPAPAAPPARVRPPAYRERGGAPGRDR